MGPGETSYRERASALKWLRLLIRLLLGGLFFALSLDKIQHPRVFAEAVLAYDLLPAITIPVAAVVLPWLELSAGLFLVLGLLSRGSALLLALMSGLFTVMVGITLARGLDINCGCFTEATWAIVNWRHLVLDLTLLLSSLALYRWGSGPLALDRFLFGAKSAESENGQTDSQSP